jgi:hypothetical protein
MLCFLTCRQVVYGEQAGGNRRTGFKVAFPYQGNDIALCGERADILGRRAAAPMIRGNRMYKLGDLVFANGGFRRVIDVDPDDNTRLLLSDVLQVRTDRDRVEMVERASLLRHWIMRAHAFMLRVRDCGLVYALTWPNCRETVGCRRRWIGT